MTGPSISVVVPSRQRRETVRRLLAALVRQTLPASRFEVIVVVNGPDDGTAQMVSTFEAPFTLRAIESQSGRAVACNTGARAAAGDLIVLLDDDMEPYPGCIEAHLAAHPPGSSLGVVGAAPIPADASSPALVRYRARGFAHKLGMLAAHGDGLPFHKVYTGNFSIRRDMFLDAGGYDEAFRRYGHEDYELALRLSRAGVRFAFSEAAGAVQHYDKSLSAFARDIVAEGRTALLFARKHPEALPHLQLGEWKDMSRSARASRRAFAAAAGYWPGLPSALVRLVARLEGRRHDRLFDVFDRLFDHLYWLGVATELRETQGGARTIDDELERLHQAARGAGGAKYGSGADSAVHDETDV